MPAPAPPARLLSLDAYRGFIMVCLSFSAFGLAASAALHLKSDPDSSFWKLMFAQWEHGEWAGWGFWDLIMPSFMFMVGTAMAFSHARRLKEGDSWMLMFRHVLLRSFILIILGVFLMYHSKAKEPWTLVNTLSQIGLCYPLVFLTWSRGFRVQAAAAIASLLLTWLIFALHGGSPQLGPTVTAEWAAQHHTGIAQAWWKCSNAAHALDVWFLNLFPRSIPFIAQDGGYQTLNFLPSLFTMIAGLMCGELVRLKDLSNQRKLSLMLIAGLAMLVIGELLGLTGLCPIVKRIWTPSFSLVSTGSCLLLLAAFFWIVDIRGWVRWTFFFIIAGSNSIALYIMSQLLKSWTSTQWQRYLGKEVFQLAGPMAEPILKAIAIGLTFWLICYWMWRNKFFVKI